MSNPSKIVSIGTKKELKKRSPKIVKDKQKIDYGFAKQTKIESKK